MISNGTAVARACALPTVELTADVARRLEVEPETLIVKTRQLLALRVWAVWYSACCRKRPKLLGGSGGACGQTLPHRAPESPNMRVAQ